MGACVCVWGGGGIALSDKPPVQSTPIFCNPGLANGIQRSTKAPLQHQLSAVAMHLHQQSFSTIYASPPPPPHPPIPAPTPLIPAPTPHIPSPQPYQNLKTNKKRGRGEGEMKERTRPHPTPTAPSLKGVCVLRYKKQNKQTKTNKRIT